MWSAQAFKQETITVEVVLPIATELGYLTSVDVRPATICQPGKYAEPWALETVNLEAVDLHIGVKVQDGGLIEANFFPNLGCPPSLALTPLV